jgi:dihydrofolate reductase
VAGDRRCYLSDLGSPVDLAMRVSIIVAMSRNRVIGREGGLPWKLSADLQRFKKLTMGHPIIMGRKTFASIGRALPGRTSIILSRRPDYQVDGALTVTSLQDAIRAAGNAEEIFVIGGGEIYSQALPLADRLYITAVETESSGDTFFPELDLTQWRLVEESSHSADAKNSYPLRFLIFDRIDRTHAIQPNS